MKNSLAKLFIKIGSTGNRLAKVKPNPQRKKKLLESGKIVSAILCVITI